MAQRHSLLVALQVGLLVSVGAVSLDSRSTLAPLENEKELDSEVRGWCEQAWGNNAKWVTFTEERFGEAEKLSGDFGAQLQGVKDAVAAKTLETMNDPIKQLEYMQSKAAQDLNFQQVRFKEEFFNARAIRYNWLVAMQSIQEIDKAVSVVCNEHKNLTAKLQEEYGKAKFLQLRAKSKSRNSRSLARRPFEYVEHTDSQCTGTGADLLTDFKAKTAEACKDKCDEFGLDCGGFVWIMSGYNKNQCLFRKGPVQNIALYHDDDRSCFQKEKPDGAKAAMKHLEGRKKRIEIMKKYCVVEANNIEKLQGLKAKIKDRRSDETKKHEEEIKVIEARMAKFKDVCESTEGDANAFAKIANKEKDSYAEMVQSVSKEQAALLDESHEQWIAWREKLANVYNNDKVKCASRKDKNFMRVVGRQEQILSVNLEGSPAAEEAADDKPPQVCPGEDELDKELKDVEEKIKEVKSWDK